MAVVLTLDVATKLAGPGGIDSEKKKKKKMSAGGGSLGPAVP